MPSRQLAAVQESQARQMLHGKESTTWLKSFCHTSLNLGHYSWAEPISQPQLSNWLSQIMRQLNVSKEKTFSLKTALISVFQKQTFAHHCLLDVFIWEKNAYRNTVAHMQPAPRVNTKKGSCSRLSYFANRLPILPREILRLRIKEKLRDITVSHAIKTYKQKDPNRCSWFLLSLNLQLGPITQRKHGKMAEDVTCHQLWQRLEVKANGDNQSHESKFQKPTRTGHVYF